MNKKKMIVISIVIISVAAIIYFMKIKPANDAKAYILKWQMTTPEAQASVASAVPGMTSAELTAFANVLKYIAAPGWGPGSELPADMQTFLTQLQQAHNIISL